MARLRAALVLVLSFTVAAQDAPTTTTPAVKTEGGLHVVTFDTLQGTVTVNLPDDLAAGDTISGTVVAEARGDDPEQKAANADTLSGVVVEMAEQEAPKSDDGKAKWIVPAAAAVAIPLILKDRAGREIGKVSVPVAKAPKPAAGGFQVPAAGQAGKPVSIGGSFDGDFATSGVKFGGQEMKVLAESPRKLIAQAPEKMSGPGEIEVSEKGVTQKCVFRNVAVKLAAPTVNLKSGQTTTMTITVEGLEGLEKPFPVTVINRSPAVVRVAQGDKQTFDVDPRKVAGGSYVTTRTLTGVVPGGFNINASILNGSLPMTRCSTVPSSGGSGAQHPTAERPDTERPNTPVGASRPPELPRPAPDTPEPPDDPERLRNATVAVHTGLEWRALADGRRIVTFRDNPPITGVIDLTPGWVYSPTRDTIPDTRTRFWSRFASYQSWTGSDLKFAGDGIVTFRDPDNAAGDLGVAAAGTPPSDEARALRSVRIHSNGLLLEPGAPVNLTLRRRGTGLGWSDVGNANGIVELDERTILVPIAVAIIQEAGQTLPAIDLPLVQLWFDGRAINRSYVTSGGGASGALVLDRDPHPGWAPERLENPGTGRLLTSQFAQDPDRIWAQCGRNGHPIQFRLIRYGVVDASTGGRESCQTVSTRTPDNLSVEQCALGWARALQTQTGNTTPAITIAISANRTTAGIAQAWRTTIHVGWGSVGGDTRDQSRLLAHEIGHVLGYSSPLFYDGAGGTGGPDNLMAGAGSTLTREQCEVAYSGARGFSSR